MDFAFGFVMGNGQEVIGCLSAVGGEGGAVDLTVFACGDSGHKIAVPVPKGTLPVRRGNVAFGANLKGGPGKILCGVDKLSIGIARQHLALLADGDLAQRFVVEILLGHDVIVHIVIGVVDDLIHPLRGNFKFHTVVGVIVITLRSLHLHHTVAAKGQLFRRFQKPVSVRVKHTGFGGGTAVARVRHFHQIRPAIFGDPVNGESGVGNSYGFSCFHIRLDELQIPLQFLIQHMETQIAVAGGGDCSVGRAEHALGSGAVDCHHKRIGLKYILGKTPRVGRCDNGVPVKGVYRVNERLSCVRFRVRGFCRGFFRVGGKFLYRAGKRISGSSLQRVHRRRQAAEAECRRQNCTGESPQNLCFHANLLSQITGI